jgi:hypothetical protein
LHDLHHEKTNDEKHYIKKMFISTLDGGLWGDFIVIYWIFEYLHHSIHVWNKNNDQIMVQIQQENTSIPLNLVYGNNHFEPVNIYSKITKYSYLYS